MVLYAARNSLCDFCAIRSASSGLIPLLHYVHGSYASSYERDLFIEVRRGVVGKEHEVVNGQAEPKAPEGYTLAAHTSMGNLKGN